MDNTLTTKEKWEAVWAGRKLPIVNKPVHDVQQQLETYLPKCGIRTLIEIGCAPGGWMAYFHKQFRYRVAGLEYAEAAAAATKVNMRLLGIDADIFLQDFFTFDCDSNSYDIVFSAGFIEHFRDVSVVMNRIYSLSQEYVVTIVPNAFGINGFISKTIRPKVYSEHNPIDVLTLDALHAACGLRTLFCDYVAGVRFVMPAQSNDFFNRHKRCARAINMPVCVLNRLSNQLQRFGAFGPRSRLFSDSLLYIGVKPER